MGTVFAHAQLNNLIFWIAMALSYAGVVMCAHYFKAWVAYKFGDNTPAEHGFFSLDPFNHLDPIGFVALYIFGIGWGRHVMINPLNIHGSYRLLRIFIAYLSDSIAYIVMGIVSMVSIVLLFGKNMIPLSIRLVAHRALDYQALHQLYPDYSSTAIALGLILLCIMFLAIMFGALQMIINLFHICLHFYNIDEYDDFFMQLFFSALLLIILIFLGGIFRWFILCSMAMSSCFIAWLLGL